MTPQYHAIVGYWKDDPERLALERLVWDPTPWILDIRSPYPGSSSASLKGGDVDRLTHINWLRENVGVESWPIHGKPGDWYFAGVTVDGQTWLGFRTEDMMRRFCEAFPQSVIRMATDAAMLPNAQDFQQAKETPWKAL